MRQRSGEQVRPLDGSKLSTKQMAGCLPVFLTSTIPVRAMPTGTRPKSSFFEVKAHLGSGRWPVTGSSWSSPPGTWSARRCVFLCPGAGCHVTTTSAELKGSSRPCSGVTTNGPRDAQKNSHGAFPGFSSVTVRLTLTSSESSGKAMLSWLSDILTSIGTTSAVMVTLRMCFSLIVYCRVFLKVCSVELSKYMSNPATAPPGMTWADGVDLDSSFSRRPSCTSTLRLRSLVKLRLRAVTELTQTRPKSITLWLTVTWWRSTVESSASQSRTSAWVPGVLLNFFVMSFVSSAGARAREPPFAPSACMSQSLSAAGGRGGIGSSRPRSMPRSGPDGSVRSRLAAVLRLVCIMDSSAFSRLTLASRRKLMYSSRWAARRSSSCTE
mmetsp:Transcript_20026/g.46358  ORF Transcript_20026/g.46358 Transcript_20026/m.46358 type:complete len:382 (+) Transcript_20026:449-1594(+)